MGDQQIIDRTAVHSTAKLIAGKISMKCNGNTCANCDRDCMCLEFAYLAHALGYEKTKSHVKNNMMKSAPFVGMTGELAKQIAVNRGYGCNEQDCCAICSLRGDCIPRDIAFHLIQNGYRKSEKE
jgi:hypothetical protein